MAIETECDGQSLEFHSSLIWYVHEANDNSFLTCRQCRGITDSFEFSDKFAIEITDSPTLLVPYHAWKSQFNVRASQKKFSKEHIERFYRDLHDMNFLHRIRKYNTFGENNPLLTSYPQEYVSLTKLMQECFALF
ncbi:MAG: hypothetical protein AB8G05_17530 [Oligoflexales bacterium]